MAALSKHIRQYGADTPLPQRYKLQAGPLSLLLEGSDLRYIKLGPVEIVRRLYVAVRNRNWDTVPQQVRMVQLDQGEDSFAVSFDVVQQQGEVDFFWHGTISGEADGTLRYTMDGEARSDFLRSRIGICLLYPDTVSGVATVVHHVAGDDEPSRFPTLIAPQEVAGSQIHPAYPFAEMRGVTHTVRPGVQATCTFAGDIFEMEDQRNWTDASYKVYSTPLRLPFPAEVAAGTTIRQSFTLRLHVEAEAALPPQIGETIGVRVTLGDERYPIPPIGFGVASHGEQLADTELARLKPLHPAHLRVDLDLAEASFRSKFRQAAAEARALSAQLEVAIHLSDDAATELATLAAALGEQPLDIARWLVFHKREKSTSAATLRLARETLHQSSAAAPIGGGTNVYFTDLNRGRPDTTALDLVAYSINPQVHAFDLSSLSETLPTQAATVASARAFCGERKLAVTPITLLPRFNPNATSPEPAPAPGELPAQVDVRQLSLYGAGWTLGSIKYLAEAGVDSLTYYETTGWGGLIERAQGSPLPDKFPSQPGQLFPLYHVFAALATFGDGRVRASRSQNPLAVESLVLEAAGHLRLLLANLSDAAHTVIITGLSAGSASVRLLDADAYDDAAHHEDALTKDGARRDIAAGELTVELPPFALACIDSQGKP